MKTTFAIDRGVLFLNLRIKTFLLFVLSVLFLFGSLQVWSQNESAIDESYLILSVNGSPNTFYDLQAATANPDFNGNLGTFTSTSSLILNGAQNQTHKCGSHNIMNGWLDYRIYLTTDVPPVFIPHEILFNTDDGTSNSCDGISTDQTWESSAANINVLNGLTSGDYYLEVYTRAEYDTNNDNNPDGTHYASNGGTNYRASFRVDMPPVADCYDTLTVYLDATGNATIT